MLACQHCCHGSVGLRHATDRFGEIADVQGLKCNALIKGEFVRFTQKL